MTLVFAAPFVLLGLAALPLLWLLVRLFPPPERRERFPPVAFLLALRNRESRPRSAPLWLVILRLLAAALAILGLAGPAVDSGVGLDSERPIAVLMDGGWASAPDWEERRDAVRALLARAERDGVPAALVRMADPPPAEAAPEFLPAREAANLLNVLEPRPWAPLRARWAGWVEEARERGAAVHWFHDAIGQDGDEALLASLGDGPTVVHVRAVGLTAFGAMRRTARGVEADMLRDWTGTNPVVVEARDSDDRTLAVSSAAFEPGVDSGVVTFELPSDVVGRIAALRIRGEESAAAIRLLDDRWQTPRVGIPADASARETPPLLLGAHYVRAALDSVAEVVEAELVELANPQVDAIVLVDRAEFGAGERQALESWIEEGGQLVRFAGPQFARWSESGAGMEPDPLLPVRISPGGRDLGGAISWRAAQPVAGFHPEGPFADLEPNPEMTVRRQILALPDAALQDRVWAELADRTPLVTARPVGKGEVVLFHSTADPAWSSVSLSGGFSGMLERTVRRAGRSEPAARDDGTRWTLETALTPWGDLAEPESGLAPVPAAELNAQPPGPETPPGIYRADTGIWTRDLYGAGSPLGAAAAFPESADIRPLVAETQREIGWMLLLLAAVLILADGIVTLWSSRRLRGPAAATAAAFLLLPVGEAPAQPALDAALQTTLAYVETGDETTDRWSAAGLAGLGRALAARTSIRPGEPFGVRLGEDDISAIPFLYWPVTSGQRNVDEAGIASLNRFLATGGLLVLDTQDGGIGVSARELQGLIRRLAIPALGPAEPDHALTRTFYLLQDFPGRWTEGRIWVAREESDTSHTDRVSPVIVGAADWASAWAQDGIGQAVVAAGEAPDQREMAMRAGINFAMYALTGNYKHDQVHLPAILERLELLRE